MLIIVPCSSKKYVSPSPLLHAHAVRAATLKKYTSKWVKLVNSEKRRFLPSEIYAGQAMTAAREAALQLGADLHVVSAGLSLVSPADLIPSYDLTVGAGGPRPFDCLTENATLPEWWDALNFEFGYRRPVAEAIRNSSGPVYIALPKNYLDMISHELASLSQTTLKRVRIVTSASAVLRHDLEKITIRYDQRLNSAEGAPRGANVSFVQRALLHFAYLSNENPRISATRSQQLLVDQALDSARPTPSNQRTRASDKTILRFIQTSTRKSPVSRTALLQRLRQIKLISCEQKRFDSLYEQILEMRI